jgi:hypothetical protein
MCILSFAVRVNTGCFVLAIVGSPYQLGRETFGIGPGQDGKQLFSRGSGGFDVQDVTDIRNLQIRLLGRLPH